MAEKIAGWETLASWFETSKRPFPWRKEVSPYAVWISEVMLQQTRAEVVIPYFLRWMHRFPDISSLARAHEEEVIKVWEGLGYYARARRLLQAARYLIEHHGGELPSCPSLLSEIPGFGPYTVGAVASFAFRRKAAAVDGNVLRFLSRYLLIQKDIAKPGVQEEFRQLTFKLLPDEKPWVVMEAMIEMGATICKKIPLCAECPLSSSCRGFAKGIAAELPVKSKAQAITRLTRQAALIQCRDSILIHQIPAGQVMAGLYEFPTFEEKTDLPSTFSHLGLLTLLSRFNDIRYSFTRYLVTLQASHYEIEKDFSWPPYTWVPISELEALPFSSGHRRLLQKFLEFREG